MREGHTAPSCVPGKQWLWFLLACHPDPSLARPTLQEGPEGSNSREGDRAVRENLAGPGQGAAAGTGQGIQDPSASRAAGLPGPHQGL